MKRYLKLYLKFIEFSFSKAMEFRIDFYFRIFMDVIFYLVSFAFFKVLYLHTPEIGGWNEQQAMVFVSCFIVMDALQMTIFANNAWFLPLAINSGDLDYYLVRPVSSFFMLNLREFAANSSLNLGIAVGFMGYTIHQYDQPLSILNLFLFLLLTLNGTVLFQLVRILFILPVFWTHSGRGLDSLYWNLEKFSERPHRIYNGIVKLVLMTVLPFTFMASVPTDVLFQENPWPQFGAALLVVGSFMCITKAIWNFAIKSYSSASS